jgi:hypothetical protein
MSYSKDTVTVITLTLVAFNAGRPPFCVPGLSPASLLTSLNCNFKVKLRPMVGRPVCLDVKTHLRPKTRFFCYSQTIADLLKWGALTDERTDWSAVYNCCWSSPAHSNLPRSKSYSTLIYINNFTCWHSISVSCQETGSLRTTAITVLHVTIVYMYV